MIKSIQKPFLSLAFAALNCNIAGDARITHVHPLAIHASWHSPDCALIGDGMITGLHGVANRQDCQYPGRED